MPNVGALFAGTGALELALADVFPNTRTVWTADSNRNAAAVLGARFPGAPNLGDVSRARWDRVEPVDILTGGFPCQDLSVAGNRDGLTAGTRSGDMWTWMATAVDRLQPGLVVIENVRGLLTATAHSPVEPCPICMGNHGRPNLRALGAVLGDLAGMGYDARWGGIHAAAVGAPHLRFRVFVVAHPHGSGWGEQWGPVPVRTEHPPPECTGEPAGPVTLLPTPVVNDMGAGKTVDEWDAWTDTMLATTTAGNGHGPSLSVEAIRPGWGRYAEAVHRWEHLTRPAPEPTELGPEGPWLSARFVEWMMGLPDAYVTGVSNVSRSAMLRLLGNGVVPQQAAEAVRRLLAV